MKMHPCHGSSQVAAFGYDEKAQAFQVRYHAGGTYRYKAVPYDVFMQFMAARSKGSFIHRHIKGLYDYELV